MYICTTVGKLKEGKLEEVLKAAEILAKATRKQPGNLYYHVYVPDNRKNCFATTEGWECVADFQEHVGHTEDPQDPLHTFNMTVGPASAGEPDIFSGESVL
ncbi:MAG: antibiotic biosynthesis monooxygenase [Eubacteriales bacterium]|nr:antibiotic biosynthesis monooxygenase [Eubacteriales bacterium]